MNRGILYMILSIILTCWVCFIPFWLWQLLSIYYYKPENLTNTTMIYINFIVTCLAYSNSCINPFLYTLLSKNYKEYLRSRQKNCINLSKIKPKRRSLRRSMVSESHAYTESIAIAQITGLTNEDVCTL
ncbi:unnamed protein product [Natator depressus]